jgi:hypothetical protein|nr:MAG TPA: HIF-1 alpha peptide bound to-peptide complex, tumor suppressor, cancer.0A [Caudoviricetes sp.]
MPLFQKKQIQRVKCLGVRTAEETKVLATYNSTIYCFLIEYTDRSRAIKEYGASDRALQELLPYISMNA